MKIPLEPCSDCGSEEIMIDVNRWCMVCTNCGAEVHLVRERLTSFECIQIWNHCQRQKEEDENI
jgi:transcription initiation factor TFIIIB Brf1 subunit/transcription initiation factor TFIIB